MTNTFRCEACDETFTEGWTDDEARAEAEAAFTADELEDAAIVCHDCWLAMREQMADLDERYVS